MDIYLADARLGNKCISLATSTSVNTCYLQSTDKFSPAFMDYFGSRGTKSEGGYQAIHPVGGEICPTMFQWQESMKQNEKSESHFSLYLLFNNLK